VTRPSASRQRSGCSPDATARVEAASFSSASPAGTRGLSQAALETLAIVAYLGPLSRPEIARIRGVVSDSAVAGLVDRGLVTESGRDGQSGAIRYRTTPLFERVFGLESLDELPSLDELSGDAVDLRARLEAVAERRGA
jgi:segregation and condensation protein B